MKRSVAMSRGMVRYRNGKPCPAGHNAQRYVSTGQCVECLLLNARQWRQKFPEKVRSYSKKYRKENYALVTEKYQKWREKNKQLHRNMSAAWRKEHPEAFRVYQARRRVRVKKSIEQHTIEQIRELHRKQGYKCVYCKCCIRKLYHVDHKTPLSKNGGNGIKNIQLLCPDCNQKKHTKDHKTFVKQIKKEKRK